MASAGVCSTIVLLLLTAAVFAFGASDTVTATGSASTQKTGNLLPVHHNSGDREETAVDKLAEAAGRRDGASGDAAASLVSTEEDGKMVGTDWGKVKKMDDDDDDDDNGDSDHDHDSDHDSDSDHDHDSDHDSDSDHDHDSDHDSDSDHDHDHDSDHDSDSDHDHDSDHDSDSDHDHDSDHDSDSDSDHDSDSDSDDGDDDDSKHGRKKKHSAPGRKGHPGGRHGDEMAKVAMKV